MNQFSEKYRTFSNTELLRVLENEQDYCPEAVTAANEELAARQLSPDDIALAKAELDKEQQEERRKKEQQEEVKNTLKERGADIINYINPIEDENEERDEQAPPKVINTISIIFFIIAILQIATQIDLIKTFFTDPEWDFSVFMFFFPIIIAPVATILFWMKKSAGWVLLSIYLGFALMGFLWVLFMSFNPTYLLGSLFFTGTLWVICQQRVRNVYKITTDIMYITIIASIAIIATILSVYFFVL
ncbi:hypothetical protein JGH11_10325 [Dysgonomonas sp. Marseille-P4677]|uniref:hypothetical protein n=1 Tax=Dysgonomonas sp. Marseille-P4677 TaxID=2364790 RepID=UPI00191415CF|nr:hypothetical protein [Dysgonomonas sp. Marseille-P4677]MBK5721266.1 hypothetical protein [Dysgonomonas sp. Marseille-P4677]